MTAPRVDLRIEQLVLHGFEGAHGPRLGAVVEQELARLIAERGVPAAWHRQEDVTVDAAAGATRPIPAGAGPADLGAGIARAVYDSLAGGER